MDEIFREMCPIVNDVWTFITKTIYFFVEALWANICFHIILIFLEQISILLLLLCSNFFQTSTVQPIHSILLKKLIWCI
jgi:hypothetical protein